MRRARWGWIKILAGYLLAAACLVWVFHDLKLPELRQALRELHWVWIPAAIACDVGNYVAQGGRWALLLRPLGTVTVSQSTGAIYAGLFVNEMLPLRVGEVLRTYLVSRRLSIEIKRVVPSVVVERFLDGFWLALAIGAVAAFIPLPEGLKRAGDLLGALVLVATFLFLVFVLRGGRATGKHAGDEVSAEADARTGKGRAWAFLRGQAEGVRSIGRSNAFWAAAGLTALMLFLQGAAFWMVLLGCHLPLSLWAGLAVFLIVHLGTAIPSAPGNVGSYQFFCVLGLSLFGVEKVQAAAFSVVVFVVLTVPLWAIGFAALRKQGLSLRWARREFARR